MKLRFFVMAMLVLSAISVFGQKKYRYAVTFRDKEGCGYSIDRPEEFLSDRALERRERQGLKITYDDLPLSRVYTDSLRRVGFGIVCENKWTNTAIVECDTTGAQVWFFAQDFIAAATSVGTYEPEPDMRCNVTNNYMKAQGDNEYGFMSSQLGVTNTTWLHSEGFRGEGMLVAVIDDGFRNADSINAGWNGKIAGFRDIVNPQNNDIYNVGSGHGTMVLSCMASDVDSVAVGGAPGASYWLMRTELDKEQPVEMYYLASALELADSLGCDIANISLGYYEFDLPFTGFVYDDLDGSSMLSVAADMAVDRGMMVVVSAGNEGDKRWRFISVPADAKKVLTVGALARNSVSAVASYSSVGPTSDGRTKPDVIAPGTASVVSYAGEPIVNSGTSFAAPLVTAGLACLWQALPELSSLELLELMREAATMADNPDNSFGYGIADFRKAYNTMKGSVMEHSAAADVRYYGGRLHFAGSGYRQVEVYGISGVCLFSGSCDSSAMDLELPGKGLYIVVVRSGNSVSTLKVAVQ